MKKRKDTHMSGDCRSCKHIYVNRMYYPCIECWGTMGIKNMWTPRKKRKAVRK